MKVRVREETQLRNVEAEIEAETMEECCLMAKLFLSCSTCFYIQPETTSHIPH